MPHPGPGSPPITIMPRNPVLAQSVLTKLLKEHLAKCFGDESVTPINGTYYKGLDVVTIDCESFRTTDERKSTRTLQDPISRRPSWRDRETSTLWQFRI